MARLPVPRLFVKNPEHLGIPATNLGASHDVLTLKCNLQPGICRCTPSLLESFVHRSLPRVNAHNFTTAGLFQKKSFDSFTIRLLGKPIERVPNVYEFYCRSGGCTLPPNVGTNRRDSPSGWPVAHVARCILEVTKAYN